MSSPLHTDPPSVVELLLLAVGIAALCSTLSPTLGYAAGAAALYGAFSAGESFACKVAREVLIPILWGTVLVALAWVALNLFDAAPAPDSTEAIRSSEQYIVQKAASLHQAVDLTLGEMLLLMAALMLVAALRSAWAPVQGAIRVKKYVKHGVAALSFAANFTFLTDRVIVTPRADDAWRRIEAHYADAIAREQKNLTA